MARTIRVNVICEDGELLDSAILDIPDDHCNVSFRTHLAGKTDPHSVEELAIGVNPEPIEGG